MEEIQCICLKSFGGLSSIQVETREFNALLADDEVIVRVEACGVNFADIYTRLGLMPDISLPTVIGLEASGVIEAVGPRVLDLKVGDRVLIHTGNHGLFQEKLKVQSRFCTVLPPGIGLQEALVLCINYLTAYFSLLKVGNLREGESVLITSAGGGVGIAAVQLARTVKNVNIAGISSIHKHDFLKEMGVKQCVSASQDFNETVNALNAIKPNGFDLILDTYGGEASSMLHRLLKPLGRRIIIGASSFIISNSIDKDALTKTSGSIQIIQLIMENTGVHGFNLTTLLDKSPSEYKKAMDFLINLYKQQKIVPIIDSVFTFNEVTEAQKRLTDRQNIGKIILVPNKLQLAKIINI
ncbi:synaptic vesicle membrane protein VAT-1 homolog isoform X3 [Artemia franciscana]|uniref:synaptic vesicle membrane protein VAT-1 homolog isoform X3 n=1 Tax=Artemia franciscana TaxID=6661 RepID=UPI0032DBEE87